MSKVEIIAPASKRDYIYTLLNAGADVIYAGLKNRTWYHNSIEFSWDELIALSKMIHSRQKKIYIAINRNLSTRDVEEILQHAHLFVNRTFDAVILSDWGGIDALRKNFADIQIHLSSNALCLDYAAFDLALRLKIQRIIFSPSFRLDEMCKIMQQYPAFEWETIILGSRCCNEVGLCKCYINKDEKLHKELCRKHYYVYKNSEKMFTEPQVWGFPLLKGKNAALLYNSGINYWKIEGRDRSIAYLTEGIRHLHRIKQTLPERNAILC